jgi:hypothetical protein
MKNAINKNSFALVTYVAYFDTRFGRDRHLNLGYGAGQILDRLMYE